MKLTKNERKSINFLIQLLQNTQWIFHFSLFFTIQIQWFYGIFRSLPFVVQNRKKKNSSSIFFFLLLFDLKIVSTKRYLSTENGISLHRPQRVTDLLYNRIGKIRNERKCCLIKREKIIVFIFLLDFFDWQYYFRPIFFL